MGFFSFIKQILVGKPYVSMFAGPYPTEQRAEFDAARYADWHLFSVGKNAPTARFPAPPNEVDVSGLDEGGTIELNGRLMNLVLTVNTCRLFTTIIQGENSGGTELFAFVIGEMPNKSRQQKDIGFLAFPGDITSLVKKACGEVVGQVKANSIERADYFQCNGAVTGHTRVNHSSAANGTSEKPEGFLRMRFLEDQNGLFYGLAYHNSNAAEMESERAEAFLMSLEPQPIPGNDLSI